jgi:hypothetical protein
MMRPDHAGPQHEVMNGKTGTEARRSSARQTAHNGPRERTAENGAGGHTAHNGEAPNRHHDAPGLDLPVFGHVPYTSVGFLTGLGVAGVVGVIEWPVVAAVGVGYALARRDPS